MRKQTKEKIIIFLTLLISTTGFAMEEIPQSAMEIIYVDSEETIGDDGAAANVLDGDPETFWHTEWYENSPDYPHEIIFKLDKEYSIENFVYLPRQNSANGRIKDYAIYVGNDTSSWGDPVAQGQWDDKTAPQIVEFDEIINGQYVKLKAISEVNDNVWAAAAEIKFNDEEDPNVDLDGWASSLHLSFRDGSDKGSELLMVDIEVDSSSPYTYYAPINFTGGYAGIQDHGENRTLHFSLWDYVDGDVQAVPDGAEARILWRGYRVNGSGFGGEGTGIKTWKNYQWKTNQPYRLLVKMRSVTIDSFPGATRDYWVFDFETNEWMHIATLWRADNPETGQPEKDLGEVHVFVEDWAATAELHRSCYVFNARKKYWGGLWHTYDHAYYTINDQENNPATADGHDPNTQAEVRDESKIWLACGGDFIPEDRTLSGTTLNITPNRNFDPENPELTNIQATIDNDSTVTITWDYEKPEWAAQERFDIRFYSDENLNNLVYKTGALYPHNYESVEWKKGSDRRFTVTKLNFNTQNTYYMRIITKTIFGINCWNSDPVKISKTTAIEDEDAAYPESLKLNQNYPNPFNPSTRIDYFVPNSMKIDLAVYNLNGDKVRQLFQGIRAQGHYTNSWAATDENNQKVSAGVYILVLKTEKLTLKKKMILIK